MNAREIHNYRLPTVANWQKPNTNTEPLIYPNYRQSYSITINLENPNLNLKSC